MNSSAKTTAITFLAAAALGAAVFMGCSVSSGTVDDTDGGTSSNNKDSGTSNADTGTTAETGTGSAVCQTKQTSAYIISPACQTCLDNKCCTQLTTCFAIEAPADNSKVDCNGYTECVESVAAECDAKPTQQEINDCYKTNCDDAAVEGVPAAYDAVAACAVDKCAADCGGEAPDGG